MAIFTLGFKTQFRVFYRDMVKRHSQRLLPLHTRILFQLPQSHHGPLWCVGLYIENLIKFKSLDNLLDPDIEALWPRLRPSRLPRGVPCLIAGVTYHRHQRVKLSSDCFSEWGPVPAGVPQGTKLSPWPFLLMINDLKVDALTWKYVDDTTISCHVISGMP